MQFNKSSSTFNFFDFLFILLSLWAGMGIHLALTEHEYLNFTQILICLGGGGFVVFFTLLRLTRFFR